MHEAGLDCNSCYKSEDNNENTDNLCALGHPSLLSYHSRCIQTEFSKSAGIQHLSTVWPEWNIESVRADKLAVRSVVILKKIRGRRLCCWVWHVNQFCRVRSVEIFQHCALCIYIWQASLGTHGVCMHNRVHCRGKIALIEKCILK